ncbi:hypothetical protein [Cryptosporangium japonicum]|uniref:Uncharacterized protein n=1 Tax=Cryptosporangium japonicum TaxID=80872 RepID=A0ABN0UWW7_9ACTN
MLKVSTFTDARLRIPKAAELVAAGAVAIAHEIAGWLLIVFAILIVAVAGPKRGSRVFAVLFAMVIVLVVLSGCSPSNASAGTDATPWLATGVAGAVAGAVAVAAAVVVTAARLTATALSALADVVRVLMWTVLVLAVLVSALIESV